MVLAKRLSTDAHVHNAFLNLDKLQDVDAS